MLPGTRATPAAERQRAGGPVSDAATDAAQDWPTIAGTVMSITAPRHMRRWMSRRARVMPMATPLPPSLTLANARTHANPDL